LGGSLTGGAIVTRKESVASYSRTGIDLDL